MLNRREVLTATAAAITTGCGTLSSSPGVLIPEAVRASICNLYHELRPMYPSLQLWVKQHQSDFTAEQWNALVAFDARAQEIDHVLQLACTDVTVTSTGKWEQAAGTVIQVAQVAAKVAKVAMAAGVL